MQACTVAMDELCDELHVDVLQALSAKLSGRILKAAREQQHEIDAEEQEQDGRERVQVGRRGLRWVESMQEHGFGETSASCYPCPNHPCTWSQISAGALAAALQRMRDSDDEDDGDEEDLGDGYDADSIYGAGDVRGSKLKSL